MTQSATVATAITGESPYVGSKDKSVGWYDKNLPELQPAAQELLERYSGIPPEKIAGHVVAMRDKAWDICPYPCIGQFRFLDLSLMRLPVYPRILTELKAGGKLLDIGCCLAQDLRKLVYDGVPSESLYGAELLAPYFDLGYELFKDRDTNKTNFIQADILEAGPSSPLNELSGSMDVIHLGMVIHVFTWDEQRAALIRCVELLKPRKGTLIVGQAVGHASGKYTPSWYDGKKSVKHSDVTFRKLVHEVEDRTGVKFEVRASIDEGLGVANGKRKWDGDTLTRRLYFEVERMTD